MRPVVGIPLGLDEVGRWRPGRATLYADAAYAGAVAGSGALAVHVPIQEDTRAALAGLHGLLLPGGGDFAPPVAYPEDVVFDLVPERQLAFDRALLAGALARGLPVLAVCYGMQLLAVERGGRLVYDLARDRPDAGPHHLPHGEGRHGLRVERGTRLADLLGAGEGAVNSRHHQAVEAPGAGLRVCARAPDGVIEAVEGEGEPFLLGVQWHPERMEAAHRDALFGGFARACAAFAARAR